MAPPKKKLAKGKATLPGKPSPRSKKTLRNSPSGKSTASDSSKAKTPAGIVGIFYKDSKEMVTFENADDAKAFHLKLPRTTRSTSEVVFFTDQAECTAFIEASSSQKAPPVASNPVTPEKRIMPRLAPAIKLESPYQTTKPSAKATGGALYNKLQNRRQTYGSRFKVHWFSCLPDGATARPFAYQFQDMQQDFNHWANKPPTWVYIWENDEESPPHERQFDDWLHGQQWCLVRDPHALIGDEPRKIKKTGKQGPYTINDLALYGLVPITCSADELVAMLKLAWTKIYESDEAQLCYHSLMKTSDKLHSATTPISSEPSAHYWNQLRGAIDTVTVETHHSLDEVFMRRQVNNILESIFGLSGEDVVRQKFAEDPQMQLEIRSFAFGR